MNVKKFFSIVLFGAMCVGFVACENEEPTNGNNSDGTSRGSYKAMVIDSELLNATAKLSATSGIAFDDEVTLTVTPDGEWESVPTVDVVNAKLKSSTENNSVYKFVYTGFTGDAVFTVDGVSTAGSNGNGSDGGTTNPTTPDFNGHEYVDLGLPSGLLWATCNVGATAPEEYGDYFAWGEVEPKSYYDWSSEGNYKWGTYDGSDSQNYGMTKYNKTDGKTVLDPEDDAAHVNWGGDWRMPTLTEMQELLDSDNCTWEWTTQNGVYGRKVTSVSNGNSIFLPAAGFRVNSSLSYAGALGYYWSSSLRTSYPSDAYYLYFYSGYYDRDDDNRYYGQSVRAVCSSR